MGNERRTPCRRHGYTGTALRGNGKEGHRICADGAGETRRRGSVPGTPF
ncbi:TPA: hypothetical protein ACGV2A_000046 [Enterococcus faecium]